MDTLFEKSVAAEDKWTYLCDVLVGRTYWFQARGTWTDWYIKADADGYDRTWLRPFRKARRAPREKWFALIGTIDRNEQTAFLIGREKVWKAPKSGGLWCFANDLRWLYGNNKGAITVAGMELDPGVHSLYPERAESP